MNPRVLRRFVIIMAIATFVTFVATIGYEYVSPPPGDYEVRKGDILLSDKHYRNRSSGSTRRLSARRTTAAR